MPGSWGQSNDGFGFLTLPSVEMAQKFMSIYGRSAPRPVSIKAAHARQPLMFEAGQKAPPGGLLEWLNRVPYPEKGDYSLRVVNDRKAENLLLDRIEFGVFCKDGVFSPEYSKSMRDAKFSFDAARKTFRISLLLEGKMSGEPPSTRLIVVQNSAVRLILSSVYEDQFSVTLIMHHPPAYEELLTANDDTTEEGITQTAGDVNGTDSSTISIQKRKKYTGRLRRPAFDHDHSGTAAFTSRVMRLVFDTEALRNDFEDLLQVIGCPPAKYVDLEHEPRRIYSNRQKSTVTKWLEQLESRAVAFQLARLYQNSLLTPQEIMKIKPTVESLYEEKGPFVTADVLHQFVEEITRLEDRWLDRILKDRGHQKELAQKVKIVEVLEQFVNKGLHRVDWRQNYNSPVMQCLHVVLTPTSMILEGPYPDQSNRPLRYWAALQVLLFLLTFRSFRKYGNHDHFIRVAFMDEDKQPYYWASMIASAAH